MKRRGKRLTLGVMVVGLAVVVCLAIVHWNTVRDHVEAWYFQLTREAETIEPDPTLKELPGGLGFGLSFSEKFTGTPDSSFPFLRLLASHSDLDVILAKNTPLVRDVTINWVSNAAGVVNMIKASLEKDGWRVLEQRFPRRAYVVIRDPAAVPDSPTAETFLIPFSAMKTTPAE